MSETLIGKAFANSFSFPGGFVIQADKPIDDRLVVHSVASLTAEDTFVSSQDGLSKAYNGMIVSVLETNDLYILKDASDTTNIYSWEKISVPQATSADAGKILTVEEVNVGTTENPDYKYEGRWVEAPSGLPEIGTGNADAGKVLTVSSNGVAEWKTIEHPTELPTIADTDKGKALFVDKTTGEVVWETVDTSLITEIRTDDLYALASSGTLKPGMKYRITDYIPTTSSSYSLTINNKTYKVGTVASSVFDIIATASTEKALFDDVELVAKDGTNGIYSMYEAKYDLYGNTSSTKYNYIEADAPGVIYYMKDHNGNEADFDFEHIVYVNTQGNKKTHTFHNNVNLVDQRRLSGTQISNVKIKSGNIASLPGVILSFNAVDRPGTLIDVVISGNRVYFEEINLVNVNINNSHDITFIAITQNNHSYRPRIENMNINSNQNLSFIWEYEILSANNAGFCLNNITFNPSIMTRSISGLSFVTSVQYIVKQYLTEIYNTSPHYFTEENTPWFIDLYNELNSDTPNNTAEYIMCMGPNINNGTDADKAMQNLLVRSAKYIVPSNKIGDMVRNIYYTLEIPQLQSTATSVVELGI